MSLLERIMRLRSARTAPRDAEGWPEQPGGRPAAGHAGHAWPHWTVLRAGTVLYHGGRDSFDRETPPRFLWLSRSPEAARFFATRLEEIPGWGDAGRACVHAYRVETDVAIPLVADENRAFRSFRKAFGIGDADNEERREGAERAGLPGWVIPGRYDEPGGPGGDDVLVADTSVLSWRSTQVRAGMPDGSTAWTEDAGEAAPGPSPA